MFFGIAGCTLEQVVWRLKIGKPGRGRLCPVSEVLKVQLIHIPTPPLARLASALLSAVSSMWLLSDAFTNFPLQVKSPIWTLTAL